MNVGYNSLDEISDNDRLVTVSNSLHDPSTNQLDNSTADQPVAVIAQQNLPATTSHLSAGHLFIFTSLVFIAPFHRGMARLSYIVR